MSHPHQRRRRYHQGKPKRPANPRPFLYPMESKRHPNEQLLLDVTVLSDTSHEKKPGLNKKQLLHYTEALKAMTLIITFLLTIFVIFLIFE